MIPVSRRNLFALAGATTILAACDPKADSGDPRTPPNPNSNNYGDNPSKPGPKALTADYYSLVIIRLNKDLKIEASHGSFESPSKDDEGKVRAAVRAQLEGLAQSGDVQSLNPMKDSSGYDFENWGFASTRRIYVYVDNATLKFEKREPLTFKAVSSIRFTDPERATGRKISQEARYSILKISFSTIMESPFHLSHPKRFFTR
jgi:hypothetical protein